MDEVDEDEEWCASAEAVGLALDERRGDIAAVFGMLPVAKLVK